MDLPKRYHPAMVILHWLVVFLVLINLTVGLLIFPNGSSRLLDGIHMTIGVSILLLMFVRLILRLKVKLPPDATIGNKFLDFAAKLVHYVLYLVLLGITLVGLVYALDTGWLQRVFFNLQIPPGELQQIFGIPLRLIHRYLAWLLSLLIAGHILAALYHQFVRKDDLLSRMWIETRSKISK